MAIKWEKNRMYYASAQIILLSTTNAKFNAIPLINFSQSEATKFFQKLSYHDQDVWKHSNPSKERNRKFLGYFFSGACRTKYYKHRTPSPFLELHDTYVCMYLGRVSANSYKCPKIYSGHAIWFNSIKLKLFKIQLSGSSLALFWFWFTKKVKINHLTY